MNGKMMPLDPVAEAAPYRLVAVKAGWKGKENRGYYKTKLIEAIRQARPDVIYLMEEPFSLFAFQVLSVKKIVCPSVPVVFFTWNNLSLDTYDYRPSVAYRNIAKLNLRSLDHALTANSDGIKVLNDFGFKKPASTIGYGVDTTHYATPRADVVMAIHAKLGIKSNDRLIGYVGRMIHMKGIDLLIEAFAKIASEDMSPKLLLLGSGEGEQEINAQIDRLGIRDRVIQLPVVPHAEVPDYMHALDILVLPSRRVGMWAEQFGRVLVEAMAAKKIVIGSSSGAIPEVIGDAGFVFTENDASDLTRVLREALAMKDAELAALQERAAKRASNDFSWKLFAERSLVAMRESLERSAKQ